MGVFGEVVADRFGQADGGVDFLEHHPFVGRADPVHTVFVGVEAPRGCRDGQITVGASHGRVGSPGSGGANLYDADMGDGSD